MVDSTLRRPGTRGISVHFERASVVSVGRGLCTPDLSFVLDDVRHGLLDLHLAGADCVIGPSATLSSRSAGSGVGGRRERLRQRLSVPGSIVTDTVDEHCRCTVDAASHATHEVFVDE